MSSCVHQLQLAVGGVPHHRPRASARGRPAAGGAGGRLCDRRSKPPCAMRPTDASQSPTPLRQPAAGACVRGCRCRCCCCCCCCCAVASRWPPRRLERQWGLARWAARQRVTRLLHHRQLSFDLPLIAPRWQIALCAAPLLSLSCLQSLCGVVGAESGCQPDPAAHQLTRPPTHYRIHQR